MSLERIIREHLYAQGVMSVAEYMTYALAHPEYGYYRTQEPFGTEGDFITAPEVSQVFGELIGIWCACQWEVMGRPDTVSLVELGPGRGTLLSDALRATKHVEGFHHACEVHLVETSQRLRDIQKHAMTTHPPHWHNDVSALPEKPALVIANEFLDALPIHQYVKGDKGWNERCLRVGDSDTLSWIENPIPAMTTALSSHFPQAKTGDVIEVSPASEAVMRQLCGHITHYGGAALLIDYGYTEPPFNSTLQAVKNHTYHPILEEIGQADITAHVNFKALHNIVSEYQTLTYDISTQGAFLKRMGIHERTEQLLSCASDNQKKNLISGTERLISGSQMGTLFKVMAVMPKHSANRIGFGDE